MVMKSYKVGQIWKYDTRSIDTGSQIIILKIEKLADIDVAHIAIEDIVCAIPSFFFNYLCF